MRTLFSWLFLVTLLAGCEQRPHGIYLTWQDLPEKYSGAVHYWFENYEGEPLLGYSNGYQGTEDDEWFIFVADAPLNGILAAEGELLISKRKHYDFAYDYLHGDVDIDVVGGRINDEWVEDGVIRIDYSFY